MHQHSPWNSRFTKIEKIDFGTEFHPTTKKQLVPTSLRPDAASREACVDVQLLRGGGGGGKSFQRWREGGLVVVGDERPGHGFRV
jgi:hypothetical protein